jgi:hypothetical protein
MSMTRTNMRRVEPGVGWRAHRRDSRSSRGWTGLAMAALVASSFALLPCSARAGPNDNSASRPWSLHLGLGPVVDFGGGVMGRMHFDMAYHFKGGDVGPALGFYVPLNFDDDEIGPKVGPIFLWDFRIARVGSAKLYLAPVVASGYGLHADVDDGDVDHYWFFHAGAQFRVLWRDRIGLFARPAGFEIWAGDGVLEGHWSFVSGLAAAF